MNGQGTFKSYFTGFILSVFLTLAAYFAVVNHLFTDKMLVAVIVVLAVAQLLVQLIFFLHMGRESKPRWNLVVFLFMLLVVTIVVAGSIWIMNNLNYNMMSPTELDSHIINDEGIRK